MQAVGGGGSGSERHSFLLSQAFFGLFRAARSGIETLFSLSSTLKRERRPELLSFRMASRDPNRNKKMKRSTAAIDLVLRRDLQAKHTYIDS